MSRAKVRPKHWASGTSSTASGPFAAARIADRASSTVSSGFFSFIAKSRSAQPLSAEIIARFAAGLFGQHDLLDPHGAVDGLEHVVDGEAGDGYGGQRLHLDAGFAQNLGRRGDAQAGQGLVRGDVDLDLGEVERVAERDQFVRALGREDSGDAGGGEDVALFGLARKAKRERFRRHDHGAARDSLPGGAGLGRDIDHMRLARRIEMSEARLFAPSCRSGRRGRR